VEEDSTEAGAVDFTEVAEQHSTAEGVLAAGSTLGLSADTRTPHIVAATMEGTPTTGVTATTEGTAVTAGATGGAAGIGAEDMVTDGAGELALGGRIGAGDGVIRIPLITVPGITRLDLIILTRTTALRAILRAIRILATGMTILPRQIPTRGLSPIRAGRQDPGDHRYLQARPT
jgi:hypothetical protein